MDGFAARSRRLKICSFSRVIICMWFVRTQADYIAWPGDYLVPKRGIFGEQNVKSKTSNVKRDGRQGLDV